MFSCVWLHFKKCFEKYFLMFGCVLENTIENTFSICCSHFLTFSRLPNEYIIHSFLKTQTKPRKKSSNLDTSCDRDRRFARSAWSALRVITIDASRDRGRSFARSRSKLRAITIDASRDRDRHGAGDVGRQYRRAWLWTISTLSSFFLPPSLSLSLSSIFLLCSDFAGIRRLGWLSLCCLPMMSSFGM